MTEHEQAEAVVNGLAGIVAYRLVNNEYWIHDGQRAFFYFGGPAIYRREDESFHGPEAIEELRKIGCAWGPVAVPEWFKGHDRH